MKPRNLTTQCKVIQPHVCNFAYEWEILIFLKPQLNLFRLGFMIRFMTKRFKIDPINCNRIAATRLHWLQSDAEGHLCKLLYTLRVLFLSALLPPDPSHHVLDI